MSHLERPSGERSRTSYRTQGGSQQPSYYQRHYRHSPTCRSATHFQRRSASPARSRSPSLHSSRLQERPPKRRRALTPLDDGISAGEPEGPIKVLPVLQNAIQSGQFPKVHDRLVGWDNWTSWRNSMKRIFIISQVEGYVDGTITRPDPLYDPDSAANWTKNDAFACFIILNNIHASQFIHTTSCKTSHEMWQALRDIHEPRHPHTAFNYLRTLFVCEAEEGADIPKHLNKLKDAREQINTLGPEHVTMSDQFFKTVLASSLPPSWELFTDPFIAEPFNVDPKVHTSSQEFIGAVISEYRGREARNAGALSGGMFNVGTSASILD